MLFTKFSYADYKYFTQLESKDLISFMNLLSSFFLVDYFKGSSELVVGGWGASTFCLIKESRIWIYYGGCCLLVNNGCKKSSKSFYAVAFDGL